MYFPNFRLNYWRAFSQLIAKRHYQQILLHFTQSDTRSDNIVNYMQYLQMNNYKAAVFTCFLQVKKTMKATLD